MPLLAPVAGIALRYILMTLAAYALLRAQAGLSHHQPAEDVLDSLPEGASARRDSDGWRGGLKMRRVIRVGPTGPGVAIDLAGLARVRLSRV